MEEKKHTAQMSLCNTNKGTSSKRLRTWFFTLNNYSKDNITQITQAFLKKNIKYIFQEEKGEEGTPHLQGCFRMTAGKTLSAVKKMIGIKEIHLEGCRDWRNSIRYCCKEETRIGDIYKNIDTSKIHRDDQQEWYEHQLEVHDSNMPEGWGLPRIPEY